MRNVKEIISNNLTKLRKEHNLTQLELAEKINYSDKAVSRWEKGEVTPDIETLNKISEIYNIPLEEIISEHSPEEKIAETHKMQKKNKVLISLLAVLTVWFVATIAFVYVQIFVGISVWTAFIWAIPSSFIVAIVFNAIWGKRKWTFILVSFLVWTFLASVFIQFLPVYNLFLIFILGVPAQIGIILWSMLKPKRKIEQISHENIEN